MLIKVYVGCSSCGKQIDELEVEEKDADKICFGVICVICSLKQTNPILLTRIVKYAEEEGKTPEKYLQEVIKMGEEMKDETKFRRI